MVILAILAIAFVIICVICAFKESKVTGLFKTFGVYGRITAYLGMFCPMGIGVFIASFFMDVFSIGESFLFLGLAAFGAFFYWNAYRKCPAFLKKKCIPSMIVSGLGLAMKICLFFFSFVWDLVGPQEMQDEHGNPVYVYNGDVYDSSGNKIGVASPDRQSYTPTEQ